MALPCLMSLPSKVAHPDLKCYLQPSVSDRVSALKKKIKPANQYKNQVENQEATTPCCYFTEKTEK